jgi:hypothetical protein
VIALNPKKKPSSSISILKPKVRGWMPPPSKVFKDNRRKLRDKFDNQ